MPFKITIEADSLGIAQAALNGVARALAEGTGPAALSDQAPSYRSGEPDPSIVQPQAELPFANGIEKWVHESPDVHAAPDRVAVPPALPDAATQTHPAEVEPKKRGRKPKAALVEDVEPPAEVITKEDEAEAEGAVDAAEPEPGPETTGISEAQLREAVRDIMDADGIPAALALLAKGGYKHVKDIPPADYGRVHAILKARA